MSLQGKTETFYTTREAAHALGIREPTVRMYVFRGTLTATKVGQTLLFPDSEIQRYKRENKGPGVKKKIL